MATSAQKSVIQSAAPTPATTSTAAPTRHGADHWVGRSSRPAPTKLAATSTIPAVRSDVPDCEAAKAGLATIIAAIARNGPRAHRRRGRPVGSVSARGERGQPARGTQHGQPERHRDDPPGPAGLPQGVPGAEQQLEPDGQPAPEHEPDGRLPSARGAPRDERDAEAEHPDGHRDGHEADDVQRDPVETLDDDAQDGEQRRAEQQGPGVRGAGHAAADDEHEGRDDAGARVGAERGERGVDRAHRERPVEQRSAGADHLQGHDRQERDEPHPGGCAGVERGARRLLSRHARQSTAAQPQVTRTAPGRRTGCRRWSRACRRCRGRAIRRAARAAPRRARTPCA